ncbi:MAG: hypothetical protein ACYCZ7_00080 [Minisyncoccota bacterium]
MQACLPESSNFCYKTLIIRRCVPAHFLKIRASRKKFENSGETLEFRQILGGNS